jgi:glycosyltransferase involved in cell wall biosynthesis
MVRGRPLITFAIPGDLGAPTGGYEYARRVIAEWRAGGRAVEVLRLPDGFPFPSDAELHDTAALLRGTTGSLLIDGLAYGALPEAVAAELGPRSTVLVHHPLCDERGMSADIAATLEASERAALAHAARVVVSSPSTARDLATRFGVPGAVVAIPGTDSAPAAPLDGDPPRILAVGTLTPRKGYGILIEALHRCRDIPWACTIVGATDRDPGEAARIGSLIESNGLADRVTLIGTATEMSAVYPAADLFVSPSLHEGYGMAVVEAMAHGLPVLTTDAGALKDTAPCARLVPAGDVTAFSDGLRALLESADERRKLGDTCRAFAQALPGWDETARIIAETMEAAP